MHLTARLFEKIKVAIKKQTTKGLSFIFVKRMLGVGGALSIAFKGLRLGDVVSLGAQSFSSFVVQTPFF